MKAIDWSRPIRCSPRGLESTPVRRVAELKGTAFQHLLVADSIPCDYEWRVNDYGVDMNGQQYVENIPEKRSGWILVALDKFSKAYPVSMLYETKEAALASRNDWMGRAAACIKIEFEDGEGL